MTDGMPKTKSNKLAAMISILLMLASSCKTQAEAPRDELVDIGTHSLYIHCIGRGRPIIVIDTGMGETYASWEAMITLLSSDARVCAYDRAGYGQSEPGPTPRDSQRAADELHQLLANSGEAGPYLLVGHSLGALNMQLYAHTYPGEVSGLVLIDPSPLAWMQGERFPELRELFNQNTIALQQEAQAASASPDPEINSKAAFLTALASENEEFFGRTAEELTAIFSFGNLPLTVLGATEPNPGFGESAQAFRQFWNEENQRLAGKSETGKFFLATGSSHHIHLDAPNLVRDAILELLP